MMTGNSYKDHGSIAQDIARAIAYSIAENRIVHMTGDRYSDVLAAECEDSAENGDVTEYWGTNVDGDTWRVHVDHGDLDRKIEEESTEIG